MEFYGNLLAKLIDIEGVRSMQDKIAFDRARRCWLVLSFAMDTIHSYPVGRNDGSNQARVGRIRSCYKCCWGACRRVVISQLNLEVLAQ